MLARQIRLKVSSPRASDPASTSAVPKSTSCCKTARQSRRQTVFQYPMAAMYVNVPKRVTNVSLAEAKKLTINVLKAAEAGVAIRVRPR